MRAGLISAGVILQQLIFIEAALAAEEGPSPFAGDLYTSLVTILIFVLLLIVLSRYAWQPMMEAINKRQAQIRDALTEAQKQKEQADELLEEYKQLLQAAEAEAEELIRQTQLKVKELQDQMLERAQKQARHIIEQANKRIEEAERQAIRRVYDASVDIAVEMARKILQREVNLEDHRILIQQGLEQLQVK